MQNVKRDQEISEAQSKKLELERELVRLELDKVNKQLGESSDTIELLNVLKSINQQLKRLTSHHQVREIPHQRVYFPHQRVYLDQNCGQNPYALHRYADDFVG